MIGAELQVRRGKIDGTWLTCTLRRQPDQLLKTKA
jgi:hypothetical protein